MNLCLVVNLEVSSYKTVDIHYFELNKKNTIYNVNVSIHLNDKND